MKKYLFLAFLLIFPSWAYSACAPVCTAGVCTVTINTSNGPNYCASPWVVPAGVTKIKFYGVSGGGGGASGGVVCGSGDSGAGGTYFHSPSSVTVVAGASEYFEVGLGGIGYQGGGCNPGANGTDTAITIGGTAFNTGGTTYGSSGSQAGQGTAVGNATPGACYAASTIGCELGGTGSTGDCYGASGGGAGGPLGVGQPGQDDSSCGGVPGGLSGIPPQFFLNADPMCPGNGAPNDSFGVSGDCDGSTLNYNGYPFGGGAPGGDSGGANPGYNGADGVLQITYPETTTSIWR